MDHNNLKVGRSDTPTTRSRLDISLDPSLRHYPILITNCRRERGPKVWDGSTVVGTGTTGDDL